MYVFLESHLSVRKSNHLKRLLAMCKLYNLFNLFGNVKGKNVTTKPRKANRVARVCSLLVCVIGRLVNSFAESNRVCSSKPSQKVSNGVYESCAPAVVL